MSACAAEADAIGLGVRVQIVARGHRKNSEQHEEDDRDDHDSRGGLRGQERCELGFAFVREFSPEVNADAEFGENDCDEDEDLERGGHFFL